MMNIDETGIVRFEFWDFVPEDRPHLHLWIRETPERAASFIEDARTRLRSYSDDARKAFYDELLVYDCGPFGGARFDAATDMFVISRERWAHMRAERTARECGLADECGRLSEKLEAAERALDRAEAELYRLQRR